VYTARSVFEFVFFFLFQHDIEVEMPEIENSLSPINTAGSQIPEVPSKHDSPNHCIEHLSRIADLEGRFSSLKYQTRTAMEQAKKSSDLLKRCLLYRIRCLSWWQKLFNSKNVIFTWPRLSRQQASNSNVSCSEPPSIFVAVFVWTSLTLASHVFAWIPFLKIVE
jgi:hypothetical protein